MNDMVVSYADERISVPKEVADFLEADRKRGQAQQKLIFFYFYVELTMEEVGKQFGISKMAISKRLKKLYAKLRSPVDTQGSSAFFIFWFTTCLRVSFIVRGTKTKRAAGVDNPLFTPGSSL